MSSIGRDPRDDARQRVIFRRVQAIARQQSDLVTDRDLNVAGVTDRRRRHWLEVGLLVREMRGVYRLGSTAPLNARAAYRAALLSVNGIGLTAFSGAACLDLASFPVRPVHVLVPRQRRPQPGVVLHRSRNVDAVKILDGDGVPCASVARIAFDLAPLVSAQRLDAVLDRAEHLKLFDFADFERELARGASRPAAAAVRAALGRLDETAGNNRVENERRLIALINRSSLPNVANNVRICGLEVDVHRPGTRAIIEADSRGFHMSPAQIAADIRRQQQLEAWGFAVMRVLWEQTTYEPEATLARAERFLVANSEPPVPGPPGV